MAGASPLGSPVCCAPCSGAGVGGRVLPAAVVMPRSRQVYSSPVQNTCCFMVPGRGRVPAGRAVEALAREAPGCLCAAGGCGCQLWACAPWGPAFPNQSRPPQPGRGVNSAHLPSLPGARLNHYLGRMPSPLSTARAWSGAAAAPAWPLEIRPIRAGLEAAWSWQLTVSGWEEGVSGGASPGCSLLGSRKAQRESHLGLKPEGLRVSVWC